MRLQLFLIICIASALVSCAMGSGTAQDLRDGGANNATGWSLPALPNLRFTKLGPEGKAIQTAIYDESGKIVAHVDWRTHGPGKAGGHVHLLNP